jgi:hypothetical protein
MVFEMRNLDDDLSRRDGRRSRVKEGCHCLGLRNAGIALGAVLV